MGILNDNEVGTSANPSTEQPLHAETAQNDDIRDDSGLVRDDSCTSFDTAGVANNDPTVIDTDMDETIVPLKTQLMRLQWKEIIPKPPSPKPTNKKAKSHRTSAFTAEIDDDGSGGEFAFLFSEADNWRSLSDGPTSSSMSEDSSIIMSSNCSLSEAIAAVLSNPLVVTLQMIKSRIVDADDDTSEDRVTINLKTSFSLILNKVDSGKGSDWILRNGWNHRLYYHVAPFFGAAAADVIGDCKLC